jgi:hypothetical protein
MFFSNTLTTKIPSTKHRPVGTTPVYMLPLGGIGVKPCLLKPDQPEPEHCGGWE